jgi:hypothetical protein
MARFAGRSAAATRVRTIRTFLAPRWIGLHVLVWSAVVAMALLGRWQLTVSNSKHFDLQNFSYVLQWWAFSGFVLLFWLRVIRDALRPPNSSGGGTDLVVRHGNGVAPIGPADLISQERKPGQAPTVYRGYVMPDSTTTPARSEGDQYHADYNDYLWRLAMADSAAQAARVAHVAHAAKAARPSADRHVPTARQRRVIEAGTDDSPTSSDG